MRIASYTKGLVIINLKLPTNISILLLEVIIMIVNTYMHSLKSTFGKVLLHQFGHLQNMHYKRFPEKPIRQNQTGLNHTGTKTHLDKNILKRTASADCHCLSNSEI